MTLKLHTNLRCQRPLMTITVYTMVAQRYLMAPLKAAASIEIRNMPLGLGPSIAWSFGSVLLVAVAVVTLRRQEVHVHHDSRTWLKETL